MNYNKIVLSDYSVVYERLEKSKFRSGFHLKKLEKDYYFSKGEEVIRSHALDFINSRLASAYPKNDGKQTPMKGHPVFVAQHATATCCRNCLQKWYGISMGRELTMIEKDYIVNMIMYWIKRDLEGENYDCDKDYK